MIITENSERLKIILSNLCNPQDKFAILNLFKDHCAAKIDCVGSLICMDQGMPFVYFLPTCCIPEAKKSSDFLKVYTKKLC